jgi:PAS domain S-box-containing protein
MTTEAQTPTPFRRLVDVCGAGAIIAGGLALLGWYVDPAFHPRIGLGSTNMAPSTALLSLLFGIVVILRGHWPSSRRVQSFAVTVGLGGSLLAGLLLCLSLLGIHPDAEHFGVRIVDLAIQLPQGHISPVAAACFLLIGLSFLGSLSLRRGTGGAALSLAAIVVAAGLASLVGVLLAEAAAYNGDFIPPAVATSLALAALGIALAALAAPRVWTEVDWNGEEARSAGGFALLGMVLTVVIVCAGGVYYRHLADTFRAAAGRELGSIADLKVSELVRYRKERLGDAAFVHNDATVAALVHRALDQSADREATGELRDWLAEYVRHENYSGAVVLDARGAVRMSTLTAGAPLCSGTAQKAREALRSGRVAMEDFHRSDVDHRICLTLLIPIADARRGNRATAVIGLSIDPEVYLYPYISRWPTPSRTAETLLVRRDGDDALFLNPLRFDRDAALRRRISLQRTEVPAAMVVGGRQGVADGIDYRGARVVAALRRVPDSPWFLVARVDASEVYAPLREQLPQLLILISALILGAGTTLGMVWRDRRARHYRRRYAAERALARERSRAQTYLDLMGTMVVAIDADGTVSLINRAGCDLLRSSQDAIVGRNWFDTFLPERDREKVRQVFGQVMAGSAGPVEYFENAVLTADGRERLVSWHNAELHDEAGRIVGALSAGQDVTEQSRASDRLRESEEKYRLLFENLNDAVFLADPSTGLLVEANKQAETLLGRSRDEVIGMHQTLLHPPGKAEEYRRNFAEHFAQGKAADYDGEVVRKDGTVVPVAISATVTEIGGRPLLLGIFHDISTRRQAEEALHESRARIAAVLDYTPLGIATLSPDMRVLDINRRLQKQFPGVTPGSHPLCYQVFTNPPREAPCDHCPSMRTLQDGQVHEAITDVPSPAGVRHIRLVSSPICDKDGRVTAIIEVTDDFTDKVLAEEQLKSQVDELQRWHSVMLGREDRVQELKREVNDLAIRVGETARYPSQVEVQTDFKAVGPQP